MDLMAEINAYRYSPEQIRARQARREARQSVVYERIGLAMGKPSVVTSARTAASGWNIRPEEDVHDGSPLGGQHPGAAALLVVRQALGEYRLPTDVELRYGGMKRASGHSAFSMDEGIVFVEATLHSLSGPRHHVDVPVIVRAGRVLSPSILIHEGNKRVMAQSTFDDIIGMGEFKANMPDRNTMYSSPPDREAAGKVKKQVPLLRPGMYSVQPARKLIASAVLGFHQGVDHDRCCDACGGKYAGLTEDGQRAFCKACAGGEATRRGFYNPDVTGYVEPGTEGKDVPGADGSNIDVGERPTKDMFTPGQKVRLKHKATARDRGGVAYPVPQGSRGTVLRDVDGANYAYYVRFDELGITTTVPREALA